MSAIYNLEPQPTASAIIHTTQGDLLVELFAKQTPLTCRNFLQHSLDGYYDGTIFHRLVPGFILQGGDPTGTGEGGESIYDRGAFSGDLDPWPMDLRKGKNAGPTGVNFKDEFHSRLKFNRRGLLGMANEGRPDTNGSQFFFTLDKTDELTGKNTVFGRVAGDSIYNLKKMGEAELEEGSERPMYPAKITSIEILVNPFEDMKKRERVAARTAAQKPAAAEKKQKKRKGAKQLLSFGDDEGDADDVPVLKKAKFDTRIVVDVDEEPAPKKKKVAKPVAPESAARDQGTSTSRNVPVTEAQSKEHERRSRSPPPRTASSKEESKPQRSYESDSEEDAPKKTLLERTNEEIAALKASMKRTIHSEPAKEKKKTVLETLIPETSIRGRKRRPGGNNDTMALQMLKAFEAKVKQAPPKDAAEPAAQAASNGSEGKVSAGDDEEPEVCDLHFIANCQSCQSWDKREAGEDSGDEGWMSHTLSFTADKLGKDLSYRKKAEEELVVIDPLEKARTLKEAKKAAREARAGATGRAWDQGPKGGRGAR
ncbi:Peptidyl-prolyl isomerase CWC27 [Coniochaeta hoffmannii]|uniref:peptidylprolyl isomerase n=1 Tax=Coniochaeta hoffmannii TaxID=91930 RepID=A0AA38VLA6_9PEZI|nr:Peptidyl-prolyl isomerase CWC27 [Coniochaeta hoffmannii]